MGLYNVVAPCVVGELHFTRRSTKPVEVDDKVAAPLVESGALELAGTFEALPDSTPLTDPADTPVGQVVREAAEPRRRRPRHSEDE